MKKLFFIMAMSVCAFTAQAQTTSGIRVGLNMTSATVSIRPRACFFPLFSFLPLWLHYNLNPLCVQY